jgi:hypothetical protein
MLRPSSSPGRVGALHGASFGLSFALALAGCVAAPPDGGGPAPEPVGAASQSVSLGCSDNTFNAPCDPDGFGPLSECEGVCRLDAKGGMACFAVTSLGGTPADLDGRLCGTPSSNDCGYLGRLCQSGKCVDPNGIGERLPDGIPCQPNAWSHLCDGACKNGFCQGLGKATCPYGRGGVGAATNCLFATCDPHSPTTCVSLPLAKATLCDDGSVCTVAPDSCDGAGTCSGPALDCNDGDPCTVDSCDPKTGCAHVQAADGASCADADPCNGAETCHAGKCLAGAPLACNDGNVCTADACVKNVGCVFIAVQDGTSCSDGNACNGAEACLAGACAAGVPLACDDGIACTVDACDPVKGCVHTPVGCADAGAGGGPGTGGAGGVGGGGGIGGAGGVAGTGGAGGVAPPNDAGAGGANAGGHAGTGGQGGTTSAGGSGGANAGGNAGTGGHGGATSAGGAGGANAGGHAGTGGGGHAGGATSAGGAGGAGASAGGHAAAGGHATTSSSGAAGAGGVAPLGRAPLDPSETGGCGCRVAPRAGADEGALFAALAVGAAAMRRRRRARRDGRAPRAAPSREPPAAPGIGAAEPPA